MKLRTKVLASFTVITSVSLSAFGLFALNSVERDAKNLLATKMDVAYREIVSLDESPITAAFNVSENLDFELLVGLYDSKGELLSFTETEIQLSELSRAAVISAEERTSEVHQQSAYLIRSIDLTNGSFIILATSLEPVNSTLLTLKQQIGFAIFVILAASLLLIIIVMNQDLLNIKKLNNEANEIANGDFDYELSQIQGKSEIANLSKSIYQMTQTLKKHSSDMQRLLGDISHELKTPLTSIKGYTEILSKKYSISESDQRAFDVLEKEIDHMTRLIDEILLISKLGTLKYELGDSILLGELVKERFGILQDLQPEREVKVFDECNQAVRVSKDLITRLIDNLIANTIAHTSPKDSVSVCVYIEEGTWTLQYEDSGPGLPFEYLTQDVLALDRFDARKSEGKGTGLGLSIIDQIAKQHNGNLTLGQSYLGGLLLRITAPLKP